MSVLRLTPLILAVALFMENMDSTVIATSLAAIAADIGTEPIALKLAMTSYLVAMAIFVPISSWMADKYGSRNVFRFAMIVFIIGSICCAFSDSLLTFVASRFLQGMGGAMMTPVARLVLVRVTPRDQLLDAMAWLTIPGLIGPIVGPPFGGFLTTYLSWHWIFLINVPIGILGVLLVSRFLPEIHRNAPRRMDFRGFFLAATTFAGIVFGLSVLTLPALPLWVGMASVVAGVLAGVTYVWHALRTEYPLLDIRLLRFPLFRSTVVAGNFFRLGMGAIPFLLPLMLQLGFGLNPFESGMITFAAAIGAIAAKFAAEWMFERYGFRQALTGGTFISALGVLAMAFYDQTTVTALMVGVLILFGFAQSIVWTGLNAFMFADIDDRDAGQANVIGQVLAQTMFALGVALGGGALELSHALRGGELSVTDFHNAFFVVAAVVLVSTLLFFRLPRFAGSNISRHGVVREGAGE
jgi:EmrB/QacA subfamily drug resistance transporter